MAVTRRRKSGHTPPVRPDEVRVKRLAALADWHDEWTARSAAKAGFDPKGRKRRGGDYSLHHVDLDARRPDLDEFHRRAMRIVVGGESVTASARRRRQADGQLSLPIGDNGGDDA